MIATSSGRKADTFVSGVGDRADSALQSHGIHEHRILEPRTWNGFPVLHSIELGHTGFDAFVSHELLALHWNGEDAGTSYPPMHGAFDSETRSRCASVRAASSSFTYHHYH